MPASGKFLLDTNIVIALPEVFVPAIGFGELFFGAAKSRRPHENSAKLEQFAAGRIILPCVLLVAREYGRLKQPRSPLRMTRDRHFRDVDGLVIAAW
jgi:predicted nucleic acid-binding protein